MKKAPPPTHCPAVGPQSGNIYRPTIWTQIMVTALDRFLRKIWLECCGHLSQFQGAGKSNRVGRSSNGDQFLHEYDMGDTTETLITIVGTTWRPPQRISSNLLHIPHQILFHPSLPLKSVTPSRYPRHITHFITHTHGLYEYA